MLDLGLVLLVWSDDVLWVDTEQFVCELHLSDHVVRVLCTLERIVEQWRHVLEGWYVKSASIKSTHHGGRQHCVVRYVMLWLIAVLL